MLTNVTEDELQEAELAGLPCRAMAWASTTRVAFIGREGRQRVAGGVRTWHGVAVFEGAAARRLRGIYNHAVLYSGPVRVGQEERHITAEVFVSHMSGHRGSSSDPAVLERSYVEFTGAGNL